MDIKNQNISFSPTLKKYVFIDFGLSKIISEGIGYKSPTRFRGSLLYCSPEMIECQKAGDYRKIDLYYNDYVGLTKTLVFSIK
jgi:serine/threonine protein kinase